MNNKKTSERLYKKQLKLMEQSIRNMIFTQIYDLVERYGIDEVEKSFNLIKNK